MANKHGLSSRQAASMARTGKSKKTKGIPMQITYKAIANSSMNKKIENGNISQITNPKGNTYYWYNKGRKVCTSTGLKTDPDGYGQYSGKSSVPFFPIRLLKRLRHAN